MQSKLIPLAQIKVDPTKNPRTDISDDSLKELQKSIKAVYELSGTHKSLLQPVVVRESSDPAYQFELRHGYRRYMAMLGLYKQNKDLNVWARQIPAIVDDHDSGDEGKGADVAFALIENIQRCEMTPVDEGAALRILIDDLNMKQKDVATLLGKSSGWVSQRMALTELATKVKSAVSEGKVGHSAARQLRRVKDKTTQKKLLDRGVKEEWQETDWKREVDRAKTREPSSVKTISPGITVTKLPEQPQEAPKPSTLKEATPHPTVPERRPTDAIAPSNHRTEKKHLPKTAPVSNHTHEVIQTAAAIREKQIHYEQNPGKSATSASYARGVSQALQWVLGLKEEI